MEAQPQKFLSMKGAKDLPIECFRQYLCARGEILYTYLLEVVCSLNHFHMRSDAGGDELKEFVCRHSKFRLNTLPPPEFKTLLFKLGNKLCKKSNY